MINFHNGRIYWVWAVYSTTIDFIIRETLITGYLVIIGSESSERPNQQGPPKVTLELLKCCLCLKPSVMLLSVL